MARMSTSKSQCLRGGAQGTVRLGSLGDDDRSRPFLELAFVGNGEHSGRFVSLVGLAGKGVEGEGLALHDGEGGLRHATF